MLFVPGGGTTYVERAMADPDLRALVQRQAASGKWTTSVCTGAFVLAEAGVLDGRRATTHWLFLDALRQRYPKVLVVNGYPRMQRDGMVLTGGGLSSAIDESLYLAGQIAGEDVGRKIELTIQYHPSPPWGVGDPSVADYDTWSVVEKRLSPWPPRVS